MDRPVHSVLRLNKWVLRMEDRKTRDFGSALGLENLRLSSITLVHHTVSSVRPQAPTGAYCGPRTKHLVELVNQETTTLP